MRLNRGWRVGDRRVSYRMGAVSIIHMRGSKSEASVPWGSPLYSKRPLISAPRQDRQAPASLPSSTNHASPCSIVAPPPPPSMSATQDSAGQETPPHHCPSLRCSFHASGWSALTETISRHPNHDHSVPTQGITPLHVYKSKNANKAWFFLASNHQLLSFFTTAAPQALTASSFILCSRSDKPNFKKTSPSFPQKWFNSTTPSRA